MGKVIMSGIVEPLTAPSSFPPVGTPLNSLTWEEIRAISDAGLAADYFAVGDTKSIVINGKVGATTFSNLSIDAFILGIDHNSAKEGTNRIHFGLGKISGKMVGLCDSYYNTQTSTSGAFTMNTSETNSGGWASCHMRKTVLGSDKAPTSPTANTLLAALPADLRAVMKAVTKYTDNTGDNSDTPDAVTATTDYLWLLADFEVDAAVNYANTYEKNSQAQYDYFKAGNSKIVYKYNDTNTAVYHWWLRSPHSVSDIQFCYVNSTGLGRCQVSSKSSAVLACFAV